MQNVKHTICPHHSVFYICFVNDGHSSFLYNFLCAFHSKFATSGHIVLLGYMDNYCQNRITCSADICYFNCFSFDMFANFLLTTNTICTISYNQPSPVILFTVLLCDSMAQGPNHVSYSFMLGLTKNDPV